MQKGPTLEITISGNPCINHIQMDWLKLQTSRSSKVANLKIMSIPPRPMTKPFGKSKGIKLGEVTSLKIMSIPSIQHSKSLLFILSNIQINIFFIMVLCEMIGFLKYEHSTLYQVLGQFYFTWRDSHQALGLIKHSTNSPCFSGETV